MRVAIVHYWFVTRRGGERVVEALCELFPQADLFALVADRSTLSPQLARHKLTTSFLQKLPGSRKWHRHLLPLYPLAVEQFDLRGYDLVISTESGPAKGVLTDPETCHICYCFTPMRYLWNFYQEYKTQSGLGPVKKPVFALTAHYARLWDQASAARVDYFAAISQTVAARIRKYYRRQAEVIHPPVEVSAAPHGRNIGDYYLVVGQLVNYKRVDLAIKACNELRRELRVVGVGEESKSLRRLAGKTVSFLGALSDREVQEQYASCRALLFPGEEDFGIVPVEAQACGRPVIAFGKGGARETVIGADRGRVLISNVAPTFRSAHADPSAGSGQALKVSATFEDRGEPALPERSTGIFFGEQSVDALVAAILKFEAVEHRFSPSFIRAHAEQFDKQHFLRKMASFVADTLEDYRAPRPPERLRAGRMAGVRAVWP